MQRRMVCWFSAGAASAIATKLTLRDNPGAVVAYCETGSEHPDNEGWTPEHDDKHSSGEMAKAAACYALDAGRAPEYRDNSFTRSYWPWDWSWWKPRAPRKNLVRAAALIVAEIERIDRATVRRMADKMAK